MSNFWAGNNAIRGNRRKVLEHKEAKFGATRSITEVTPVCNNIRYDPNDPCPCGVCVQTDPFEPQSQAQSQVSVTSICNRRQAPSGFKYVSLNGRCILINKATGAVVNTGSTPTPTSNILSAPNAIGRVITWAQANKGIALGALALGFYFLTKNK